MDLIESLLGLFMIGGMGCLVYLGLVGNQQQEGESNNWGFPKIPTGVYGQLPLSGHYATDDWRTTKNPFPRK